MTKHIPSKRILLVVVVAIFLAAQDCVAHAQVTPAAPTKSLPFVSPIFGDNMVLQRGKLNTIWGWSAPGDTVHVQIEDHAASAVAGPDHRWQVKIQPTVAEALTRFVSRGMKQSVVSS